MGFPSAAADYNESKLSLDRHCNTNNPGVFYFRSGVTSLREGIKSGALLVVDCGATAVDGSIVICIIQGEFRLQRLRKHPAPCLQHLDRTDKNYGKRKLTTVLTLTLMGALRSRAEVHQHDWLAIPA
ncbi:hypothetical protein MTQ28_23900, partial [Escherichia coli]|nr:hypothetical protein [Escherichia coli]